MLLTNQMLHCKHIAAFYSYIFLVLLLVVLVHVYIIECVQWYTIVGTSYVIMLMLMSIEINLSRLFPTHRVLTLYEKHGEDLIV